MPYVPSLERAPTYARNGIVATSQPLAAQAGLHILRQGGNAVDAALAAAIALTVVEPVSNGIGGDAFALVRYEGATIGLNGSGRSPRTQPPPAFPDPPIPRLGWDTVTVPGTPRAWADLHDRAGRLPFERLFEPALHYARTGFVVTPMVARNWHMAERRFANARARLPEIAGWFATFTLDGRPPQVGDTVRLPDHAQTLERIARSHADDLYDGESARAIVDFAAGTGGYLSHDDLVAHAGAWVEPRSVAYRDALVWELPPNGQGIVALQALGILAGVDFAGLDAIERVHLQVEALKIAFADAGAHIADPEWAPYDLNLHLDRMRLAAHRAAIGPEAGDPATLSPQPGGTVYVAAADAEGTLVSWIQSNYEFFGSGVVVPGTGIALQNRGAGFATDPSHVNTWAPGKRPYHTIIPALFEHPELGQGPLGMIGGHLQPQGHVQLVSRLVDDRAGLQDAVDAWRFLWRQGRRLDIERHAPAHIADALALRGHEVVLLPDTGRYDFGRAQIVLRRSDGVLAGASDARADGLAAGY